MKEAYKRQAEMLDSFVRQSITQQSKFWDDQFDKLQPRFKINYIKNEYLIDLSKEGEDIYNEAANKIGEGIYETSGAYLADAENPTEVASRQMILMEKVEELSGNRVDTMTGNEAVRYEQITGERLKFPIKD